MFVTLLNSYCSVCLSEGLFPAKLSEGFLEHRKIAKREKASFFSSLTTAKIFFQLLAQTNSAL